jgi:hypothetical protein
MIDRLIEEEWIKRRRKEEGAEAWLREESRIRLDGGRLVGRTRTCRVTIRGLHWDRDKTKERRMHRPWQADLRERCAWGPDSLIIQSTIVPPSA